MPKTSGLVTRFPVTDLFFRSCFAFFIIELKTRRVVHVGVTRSPTDAWVAQQLREATPYGQAPRANATCERFLRSVRQECLDHLLIFHERQLQRVLNAYVAYFNQARPHRGIQQQIPVACGLPRPSRHAADKVIAVSILGGLHHDYQWVA